MFRKISQATAVGAVLLLGACASLERAYIALKEDILGFKRPPAVVRQPVLPEMLVNCRGHVLVPALA
ncbi:MAG: hypothetical protein EXQ84_07265 [Rhodospirillaceae bacterium]|nr:hypothetical protein [Rhodospirillaceae bacterium]